MHFSSIWRSDIQKKIKKAFLSFQNARHVVMDVVSGKQIQVEEQFDW